MFTKFLSKFYVVTNMKKIIILVITVTILCLGAFVYLQYFTPSARAKSTADSYMKALIAGDTQTAGVLYSAEAPASEILQRNYRQVGLATENNLYYILYEFPDNQQPSMLRVGVDGASIKSVTTGSQLGSVPSADRALLDEQSAVQSRCLVKADLAYLDSTSVYARNIRGATMIFPSGSTEYMATEESESILDRTVSFYKKSSSKDFIFELKGYRQNTGLTQEENEKLNDLFQRRAVLLQEELVRRGIPLDRITINDRFNYYAPGQSTTFESDLYVDINIVNRCIEE